MLLVVCSVCLVFIAMRVCDISAHVSNANRRVSSGLPKEKHTQGTIHTINAPVDKNLETSLPNATDLTNTFRPLIEQDGNIYLAAIFGAATEYRRKWRFDRL